MSERGEMAEWSKAVASKAIIPRNRDRGFESPSLLQQRVGPGYKSMLKKILFFCCLIGNLFQPYLVGMIDNRFLDQYLLYRDPKIYNSDRQHYTIQPFVMTAHSGWGNFDDEKTRLFEINGSYDQATIDKALQTSGRTHESLLRSDLSNALTSIPWFMRGRLEIYGIGFRAEEMITDCFGIGTVLYYAHGRSRMEMVRNKETTRGSILGEGDERELCLLNEEMHQLLGVTPPLWSTTVFGDVDLYLIGKKIYDYAYKCKHIELSLKLGTLMPAAPQRNVNNPASIPLGGNRHWGLYGWAEGYFLLKEDLSCGLFLQVSKRFSRTQCMRIPSLTEPTIYGAIVGPFKVNPGVTIGFSPYATFERVREGLGFGLAYTLVAHREDSLTNLASLPPHITVNETLAERRSQWKSEYVTLRAFYDCAFECEMQGRGALPVVSFLWDIPVNWIIAQGSYKTHGVSFIVEMRF